MKLLVAASLIALVTPAFAQDDDREAQRKKEEMASLGRDLTPVAPEGGVDKAPLRAPSWCQGVKLEGSPSPGSVGRSITASQKYGYDGLAKAAEVTCYWPNEPVMQKAAQIVEQMWMNMTGQPDAEAVESLHARIDDAHIKSEQKKLCDELVISEEITGDEKAFHQSRRALFGCALSPDAPMWVDSGRRTPDDLITYMDVNSVPPDGLVELAAVLDHGRFALGEHGIYFDNALINYVTDQVDYKSFQPQRALQMLEQPPYKGNGWARIVVSESLGRAKLTIAAVEDAVKKKTSDADWKDFLVTSPQRGIAEWQKSAAAHKEVLARSNEFEHKWWGVSRRALKGCWSALRKDFVGVAKTLKHGTSVEFKEALSDPIASLLFMRLAACAAYDGGDKDYASQLLAQAADLRFARGPRTAAYYAALDTLGKITEDRPKFPIKQSDFHLFKNNALYSDALDVARKDRSGMGFVGDGGKGIVKSIKKGPKGVEITFVTTSHQEMGRDCAFTNRIITWRADGSPVYYQKCHDTGLFTVNDTPGAITVPAEWAEGITVGSSVEFSAMLGKPPARTGLPKAVYSDKSKKKLVGYYGFPL